MPITTKFQLASLPILALRLSRLRLQASVRRTLSTLGLRRRARYSLAELAIPDSEIASKVTSLVTEVAPAFLVNHSIRSYLFGAALGLRDGLKFDREVLYLGAVMHDLGLTSYCSGPDAFELEGAQSARAFLLDSRYDARKADIVHEAIALHTSIGLAAGREPEIALVQLGSGLDMVGLRSNDLAAEMVKEVLDVHPRLDLKAQMILLAQRAVIGKSDCPLASLMRLGFSRLVRSAPFVD
jgi:hypothetical protein